MKDAAPLASGDRVAVIIAPVGARLISPAGVVIDREPGGEYRVRLDFPAYLPAPNGGFTLTSQIRTAKENLARAVSLSESREKL